MGLFDRSRNNQQQLSDEQAVERYRYLLRTAPPETIERAHEEAFAQMTPEQRQLALQQLAEAAPPEERRYAKDDPHSLARLATRSELRQPGILERLFGGTRFGGGGYGYAGGGGMTGGGIGLGGMLAGSLLASVAGSMIGSTIANSFFHDHGLGSFGGQGFMDAGGSDPSGPGSGLAPTQDDLASYDTNDFAYDEGQDSGLGEDVGGDMDFGGDDLG